VELEDVNTIHWVELRRDTEEKEEDAMILNLELGDRGRHN
jgi:hypothetical protein